MVLWEHDQIIERWKGYFGKLLNEENPRTVVTDGVPNEGVTPAINRKEVDVALKGMKHGKAMGPDGIPVEVWKSLGEEGVDMLLGDSPAGSAPEDFRAGENARGMEGQCDYANIQREGGHIGLWELQRQQDDITHTMKIWERIIDRRLREETSI